MTNDPDSSPTIFARMTRRLQLSELVALIQETIEERFYYDSFWITAEICDVKKYDSKRWCFLKFVQKHGNQVATEMQGVFWANAFQQILLFEKITNQVFKDGIEISCRVQVKFHPRYGLKLEVLEIDSSYALGRIEMERQQTLDRLLRENPGTIQLIDDEYITFNKQLKLPTVVQRIALITAPNSDGQRDFLQELHKNVYGYKFLVTPFLTQLQGDAAASLISEQLRKIYYRSPDFDAVAIVRGGGSQMDFKSFDNYDLARQVALFSIPVFTGIGHDRNTSITDLMARQLKTPTKVAAALVDINFQFENNVQALSSRLDDAVNELLREKTQRLSRWEERIGILIPQRLQSRKSRIADWKVRLAMDVNRLLQRQSLNLTACDEKLKKSAADYIRLKRTQLKTSARLVHQFSPQTVLKRGFAILMRNEKLIANPAQLKPNETIKAVLQSGSVESIITQINTDDQPDF